MGAADVAQVSVSLGCEVPPTFGRGWELKGKSLFLSYDHWTSEGWVRPKSVSLVGWIQHRLLEVPLFSLYLLWMRAENGKSQGHHYICGFTHDERSLTGIHVDFFGGWMNISVQVIIHQATSEGRLAMTFALFDFCRVSWLSHGSKRSFWLQDGSMATKAPAPRGAPSRDP